MKNLTYVVLLFLRPLMVSSQTVPIFALTSYTTTGLSSPPFDSLSHICYGNTIDISLFRYIQIGVQPKTNITLNGDTLKFTLQDTALTILTLDGIVRFNYTLSGLASKNYFAKFYNKLYEVDCRNVSIQTIQRNQIFMRKGNIIKINNPNSSTSRIYNLSGKLILATSIEIIDLNQLNLTSGIYIIHIVVGASSFIEKFILE